MLLLVLALFWVALLAPVAIRWVRDGRGERSIDSFHAEHEILSRPNYVVTPAHRLDDPDDEEFYEPVVERRAHLRVVRSDDTLGTLEARSNWDEWSADYAFDEPSDTSATPSNHYARAYSSRPRDPEIVAAYEAPLRRRTMKQQRRLIFASLVGFAGLLTVAAVLSSSSLVVDLAALGWFAVVLYVALALFAVSQGYLSQPNVNVPWVSLRSRTAEPVYEYYDQGEYAYYEDELEPVYEEAYPPVAWSHDTDRRRAFG